MISPEDLARSLGHENLYTELDNASFAAGTVGQREALIEIANTFKSFEYSNLPLTDLFKMANTFKSLRYRNLPLTDLFKIINAYNTYNKDPSLKLFGGKKRRRKTQQRKRKGRKTRRS